MTWYLPTTFAQFVLCDNDTFKPNKTPQQLRDYYQKEYMGYVENVRKICLPINDNYNHWYLLIIDLFEKELILLDSLRNPNRREYRRRQVKLVAISLEYMLLDNSFYERETTYKPILSDIGQQRIDSGDCGVWVCQWMIESGLHHNYHKIQVQQETRLRIALDLVLDSYNKLYEKVMRKALKYWTDLENKRRNLFTI